MGAGTPEIRRQEAAAAARDLKLDVHEVLDLGDTRLEDSYQNRLIVASLVRKYRPQVVLAPYYGLEPSRGRGHGDHIACGHVVTHGTNFAHLEKFPAEGAPHAVKKMLYYFLPPFMRPLGPAEVFPHPAGVVCQLPRGAGRGKIRTGLLRSGCAPDRGPVLPLYRSGSEWGRPPRAGAVRGASFQEAR
jgi:hypothetical protein